MNISLRLKSIRRSYLFIPSITSLLFPSFYTTGRQYLGFEKLSKVFNGYIKYSFENMSVVTGYGVHICFLPDLSYSASCVIELYTTCSK